MTKLIVTVASLLVVAAVTLQCRSSHSLDWQQERDVRWAKLSAGGLFDKTGFEMLSPSKTNIRFVNTLTDDQIKTNRVLLNGSGVALGDIDADGLTDIYFCSLDGPNVLYKNLGGWQFQDITEAAGVGCDNQFSSGATFADIDGDTDLDLLLTAIGETVKCFLNDGSGRFQSADVFSDHEAKSGATTMALADIDDDGDLDLYVANYKRIRTRDFYTPFELGFPNIVKQTENGYQITEKFKDHYRLETIGSQLFWFETAEPDVLFINDGEAKFKPSSKEKHRFLDETGNPVDPSSLKDWGLMVRFQDMDDDGDPDIYVCNDFESPDRIWINDGTGHFRAIPKLAIRSTSSSSMAVDFSDVDRDHDLDFFVADMLSRVHQRRKTQMQSGAALSRDPLGPLHERPQYARNTLFLNRGDQTYAEIAQFAGVQASEWSWSVAFLDVDLDGYEDLLATTGNYHDAQDLDTQEWMRQQISGRMGVTKDAVFRYPKLPLQNLAFRNRGDLTFEELSDNWQFNTVDISHGMALGDLDNDGDSDLVINRLNKPALVYRNKATAPRIAVRLKGLPPNTQGIGAKIRLVGGPVLQSKEIVSGGYYLSGSDPIAVFAVGEESDSLSLEVTWRNGKESLVDRVKPNHIYEIDETGAQPVPPTPPSNSQHFQTIFEDVSHLIEHVHHEEPFNDFARQPLLPNRLSQLGPGVAWQDLDGDSYDDLVITTGRGGRLACFKNDGTGGFTKLSGDLLKNPSEKDQTAALGFTTENGQSCLLVGHSNFEDAEPSKSYVLRYDFLDGKPESSQQVEVTASSIGAMALADYDGDHDLDLFVAGRTVPGRYPEAASSVLLRNQKGAFTRDVSNSQVLDNLGLVTRAVFSDLDGDGDSDLVLSLEWGPITVLRNDAGTFHNVTSELGLANFTGWWNGVTTGDLDEDGKLDIIATNWGLNHKYHLSDNQPLRIYFHDFDNNGILDIIEAYYDSQMQAIVPERNLSILRKAMPFLRIRNRTHKIFAQRNIKQIIGPRLEQATELQVNTLEHMIFFNRETYFEGKPLPKTAQFAPAFYAGMADFDGDGHEDVFLSQNFFANQPETPRSDAGRALWLKGDGAGNLKPIPGQRSGIKVYGEQRGAALGDYDRDGRVDLAVSQNGHETKLYKNVGGRPGLRVKLQGPAGNPSGIGATVRLVYENDMGPVRELHCGSGYWSQDSAVQVMGTGKDPKEVWVRWPGGETTRVPVDDSGTDDIIVRYNNGSSGATHSN